MSFLHGGDGRAHVLDVDERGVLAVCGEGDGVVIGGWRRAFAAWDDDYCGYGGDHAVFKEIP